MTETSNSLAAIEVIDETLTRRFILDHPTDATKIIERSDLSTIAEVLARQPLFAQLPLWSRLVPNIASQLLLALPEALATQLLSELLPHHAVKILSQFNDTQQKTYLDNMGPAIQKELTTLMSYPENCAGYLMDTRIMHFRGDMTVEETLQKLRKHKLKTTKVIFLVDGEGRLTSKVLIQDIATADLETCLEDIAKPTSMAVKGTTPIEEVADLFSEQKLLDLPVVDLDNHLLGIIYHDSLLRASQQEISSDVLAMVGASREERALSSPFFALKKRMPWLQVNLITAFMAASVVGLFESTIAQFTALAVLLPVVAGQSGNSGAQALAVTMRGLALREITTRQWMKVMFKEVNVGFMNGLCVALTCGVGVYYWSGSVGLVIVICLSMVLAMIAAGFAGALVPILLVRFGQDPAQASSIILTTVTDIAGFFAFLGIATLLSNML